MELFVQIISISLALSLNWNVLGATSKGNSLSSQPVEKTVFCENHKSRPLFCPSGTVIAVHDAFYGSTASRARCGTTSSRLNCSEPSAYAIVSSACSNKSSCTLQANASLLGVDPCPGIIKFLEVGYTCKTNICPAGGQKDDRFLGLLKWNSTEVNHMAKTTCPFQNEGYAHRFCQWDSNGNPSWGPIDISKCVNKRKDRQRGIDNLTTKNITTIDKAKTVSSQLSYLTEAPSPDSFTADELKIIVDTLEMLAPYARFDDEVFIDILDIVDEYLEETDHTILEAQRKFNTSSRILMLLGDVAEGNVRNRRTYQKIGKGFALAVTNITDMTAFKGIQSYVTSTGASSDAKKIFIENNYGQSINSSTDVSISVPPEIREKSKRTSMVTVFLVYFNLKLFQGKQKLSSEVMSAEMRTEKFRDLSSPVIITFKKDNLTSMNKKPLCAWFDFQKSGGQGDWSTEGCTLVQKQGKELVCHCNHMTNFALIFGAKEPTEEGHRLTLSALTYFGCGFSLMGAFITLIAYIFLLVSSKTRRMSISARHLSSHSFSNGGTSNGSKTDSGRNLREQMAKRQRKNRDKIPPKILINLLTAYILMIILFVISTTGNRNNSECKSAAVFLQYFLLSVFSWSAIEGFTSFRGLVQPMATKIENFMWKAVAIGWGIPLAFVIVGIVIWPDNYGSSKSLFNAAPISMRGMVVVTGSCFVSGLAFYLTIIIPIALVVLSNGLVLLFIVRALKKSGKIQSSSDSDNKTDRLYVIIAFTLLFGLTWSFGFLVISNDVIVFQYLFCFFGTFHGFFLFLFFCLRNKSIRSTCENFLGRSWKRATCYEVNTSTIENRHSMEIDIDSASPGTFKQVEEV